MLPICRTIVFLVASGLSFLVGVCAITGEITSCPACTLNHLPEVRRFLKDPGHADGYERLTITWIRGRRPELRISEDFGAVVETIDLSPYTTQQLHELMSSKGFVRKSGVPMPPLAQNVYLRAASK